MTAHATPTRDEIVNLEKAYWDAMKAKDGAGTARLSGDHAIVAGPQGVMTIPKAKMAAMTERDDWTLESYRFSDIQVATPAPGVAIIAYKVTQKVTLAGKPQEMHAADISTWIKGRDGWECHAHSETILQDAKAH